MRTRFAVLLLVIGTLLQMPASAQLAIIQKGPITANVTGPSLGVDSLNGQTYFCNGPCTPGDVLVGVYEGTTATSITTANFTSLSGPNISIPAFNGQGEANVVNKFFRVSGHGVYTTGAASQVALQVLVCQGSNACGGTTVAPAGCSLTPSAATNQANVLANAQFDFECDLTTAATGSSGTIMAKGLFEFELGAATTAALSKFADTATAVSAAIDLTQAEFLVPQFKFVTSNAGNAATIQDYKVEQLD